MYDVWEKFGPPAFITLALVHSTKKKGRKGAKNSESTGEKKVGTMADLAAQFGVVGKIKKAIF